MTPSLNCVAPVATLPCPSGAPATTVPTAAPTGSPTGANQRNPATLANPDPVALLAEAVDQLRLAVAALQQSTDPVNKETSANASTAKDVAGKDRRISALARAIRETQGDVGELLASRSFGPSGPGFAYSSIADPRINAGSSPFADASFTDAGSFFAEQTTEPDF